MRTITRKIPARVSVKYQCKKCRSSYGSKERALKCEAQPIESKLFSIGDHVKWREQHHCGYCEKNHFPKGKVVRIFGPMLPDEEYNNKWLQGELFGKHAFQYEVEWLCPYCKDPKSNLFYSPELQKI